MIPYNYNIHVHVHIQCTLYVYKRTKWYSFEKHTLIETGRQAIVDVINSHLWIKRTQRDNAIYRACVYVPDLLQHQLEHTG